MVSTLSSILALAALVGANPLQPRAVDSLNEAATTEAHQRDNGANRAFSNVQIKTSDGKCLFVDKLSGDFRANLTPIQVADCGSTDGQGWDVITAGKHIKGNNVMLIVSTLTQACFNFDDRRRPGNQVLLFSCGGEVTNSQLFSLNGGAGPLSLKPQNKAGSCLVVKGNAVDIANCNDGDASQSFTFGGAAAGGGNNNNGGNNSGNSSNSVKASTTCTKTTRTVTAAPTQNVDNGAAQTSAAPTQATTTARGEGSRPGTEITNGIPTTNPTAPIPVSRAGGTLQPTAAAQSHQRDETAKRAFSNVSIRAPNGQCLFIDPTAGDFRQNLIPVSLVDCTDSPNEKWDVITEGRHNKAEGETDGNQRFPFIGQTSFALAPGNEGKRTWGIRILDLLLPLPSPVLRPASVRAHHVASAARRITRCANTLRNRTWNGTISQGALTKRAFSTSSPQRVTHAIFNPQLDEDGKEMMLEITSARSKGTPFHNSLTTFYHLHFREHNADNPQRLTDIMTKDTNPHLALRIQVESGGCHGFQYLMKLVTLPSALPTTTTDTSNSPPSLASSDNDSTIREDDTIFTFAPNESAPPGDLSSPKIILDFPSLELLKGSKVDFTMELIGSQFKIVDNPLATSSCGCGTSFDIKI
ncbi:[4Fe-4S] proteins maturation [Collariella sp. IMI 366227]|nr:[4Fe-4S] proteins maturation [Collariella sp. IMI 366227]